MKSEFYTLKGYQILDNNQITEAMEDYIEMIYRLIKNDNHTTIKQLSNKLNVTPSSSSKMVTKLKLMNLVEFEKYGKISLTNSGLKLGKYYLYRHNTLKKIFKIINKDSYCLKQVEQIEHFIDYETITNLNNWIKKQN